MACQVAHAFWSLLEAAAAPTGAGGVQESVLLRAVLCLLGGAPMGAMLRATLLDRACGRWSVSPGGRSLCGAWLGRGCG